jgi:hypothetical protein
MKRILIMGLSGTGKTTLAQTLVSSLLQAGHTVGHLNADEIRKLYDDWDFSPAGRTRQAQRMHKLSMDATYDYVIADFICPLEEYRRIFAADYVVWMDTHNKSSYADTDAVFEPPRQYNLRITKNNDGNIAKVLNDLNKSYK